MVLGVKTEKIAEYKAEFANPYKAARRGYVDDVIDPSQTRPRLAAALAMLAGGFFYLDSYRSRIVDGRVTQSIREARLIAEAIVSKLRL